MAEAATMKIDIPGVDFAAMARQAIAERLTEAMVGADDKIRAIVMAAIEHKVGADGKKSDYSSYNTTPYIEWLAQDLIRKAAFDVMAKKVDALRPAIEKAIEAELRRSTKVFAKALSEAFAERAKNAYGLSCDIVLKVKSNE